MDLVSFVKALFNFQTPREIVDSPSDIQAHKGDATTSSSDDHAYIRGNIENRGPCPGLNSLANQGWMYVAIRLPLFLKADNYPIATGMARTSPLLKLKRL